MGKLRLTLLGGFEARSDSGFSLAIPRKKAVFISGGMSRNELFFVKAGRPN